MTEEGDVKASIRKGLGHLADLKLFNCPNGTAWVGEAVKVKIQSGFAMLLKAARKITFGLIPGSGDLIGWRTVEITQDMVGQKVAVFLSIEVKTNTGKVGALQKHWRKMVNEAGGIAIVARSVSEAKEKLGV